MEPFQHAGVWWDPRDPSQRWVGTLRFDRRDGIGLTLTVPVEEPVLLPDLREHDDGAFRFSVRSAVAGSIGNRRATLREETRFEIHASTPTPLSELQRQVRVCGDFLSIACLALCETEELELSLPAGDEDARPERGTFHAVPIYRGREGRPSVANMLFRFGDIAERAPELFRSWLSHSEELYDSRALYFAGAYGGGFIEGKLLSLTQAVEAFHRRFRQGLYIDKKQFRTEVLKPMLAAIPEGTDERVRKSLQDRLNYANEYTQRERLESLVREFEMALRTLVADPLIYAAAIIKHRSAFTHFDPKSRKSSDGSSVEPERVLLYNFFLRLLLEVCFLESMGFTSSEIATIVQRSETYRQLSVRFRAWAIKAPSPPGSEASVPSES